MAMSRICIFSDGQHKRLRLDLDGDRTAFVKHLFELTLSLVDVQSAVALADFGKAAIDPELARVEMDRCCERYIPGVVDF